MKSNLVAIVIPLYQTNLSTSEQASLSLAKKTFRDYDIYFVAPEALKTPTDIRTIRFENSYFKNVKSYSQLLLTKTFYEAFESYRYILIYQLDALVLNDKLASWCGQGFDYIGAPWWRSLIGLLTSTKSGLKHVGNGGLSLRKVTSHLQVIAVAEKQATVVSPSYQQTLLSFMQALLQGKTRQKWLKFAPKYYPFNEDGFWSFEACKYVPSFKIPSFAQANLFAIETHAQASLALNGGQLPFGVHAWQKYDKEFWLKILEKHHIL